jgi:hypothetical protein
MSAPPLVPASTVTKLSGEIPTIQSDSGSADVYSKICIALDGHVRSVKIITASPGIASELQRSLLRWRYKPYVDDVGRPSPACSRSAFDWCSSAPIEPRGCRPRHSGGRRDDEPGILKIVDVQDTCVATWRTRVPVEIAKIDCMLAAVTSVMTAASARCWRIVASCTSARVVQTRRWSRSTRNWSPVEFVVLNPERMPHQVAA